MKPQFAKSPYLVLALLLAGSTTNLLAQEDEEIEEVTVTGSRISLDPNMESSAPVETISGDAIRDSGQYSLVDVLNDVPSLLSSTSSESSIDSDDTDFIDGSNVLDLRGLGATRTLVLVNGRRHIGGVQGSAAVDIGSISPSLVERVEVLTGGASAVYGADSVTGVVNFILKDRFEGFELDVRQGLSHESDADQTMLNALWGSSFADNRGNITVNFSWENDEGLRVSERSNGALLGSGRDWLNPAKRFQKGDIDPATMPNFARFYNYENTGRLNYGFEVPDEADFIAQYNEQFNSNPTLSDAERAFIANAAAAPERAVLPGRTFPFTSGYGYVAPGNAFSFTGFSAETPVDLNNNGRPDCLDSFTGFNSSLDGNGAFGALGGCWNVSADGSYSPVNDGLVASSFQGFGGDSFNTIQQDFGYILRPEDKTSLDILATYELSGSKELFLEAKYVKQSTENEGQPTSFWDLLLGAPDNPFLPDFLVPIAQEHGGVSITLDPIGIGSGRTTVDRETARFVFGLRGEYSEDLQYELSLNYGQVDREFRQYDQLINDRFLAAIDAVTDPATGAPACRADVDPSAPATTTPFNIPVYDPGYYSFTPGSGQCVPLDIWNGASGITDEALAFVTTTARDQLKLEQFVISGFITASSRPFFELPAGPVSFAAGLEYREEKSEATFDNFQLGIIPANAPFPEGSNIADHSENSNLVFRPNLSNRNEVGSYDAADAFIEASVPVIENMYLDLATRYSDYSTIGEATSWRVSLSYRPIEDLLLRATVSETVRAPNINELFGPQIGVTYRPTDPCDASQISAVRADNPVLADQTQANCVAALQGLSVNVFDADGNYVFSDPLSASFGGTEGGNAELDEETAKTTTFGFVFTPSFVDGLRFSIDRWEIEIDDAIDLVGAQDIVNGCYATGAGLNDSFCGLLSRNGTVGSQQHGGLNFIRSTSINYVRQEAAGIDFTAAYDFDLGAHSFGLRLQGTETEKLDDYTNPLDPSFKNPELKEYSRPRFAGSVNLSWSYADIDVNWQSNYQGEQLLKFLEIESAVSQYGESVLMDEVWVHNLNASYNIDDAWRVYGGVNNASNEEQFITNRAFPTSPRGRYFFLGVNYKIM
ncbi:MAG: TonB-dependent receptor [Cellvibrionaceae bacterium]|nr:TonB-dependent receptor [Cellvibrionaceae bacterium]